MSCPFVMDLIRPQNPHSLQSCQDAVEHFQTKLHAMLAGLWDGPFDGLAQEISPKFCHQKIIKKVQSTKTFTFPSRFEREGVRKSRTWSQKFQVKFSNNTNPADVLWKPQAMQDPTKGCFGKKTIFLNIALVLGVGMKLRPTLVHSESRCVER